jgi:hypothetical protein
MEALDYPASFLDLPRKDFRPMTEDESGMFIRACMLDIKDSTLTDFSSVEGSMPHATVVARLRAAGLDITMSAFLAILSWSNGRPGDFVMWAYTASHIARNKGIKLIKHEDLVNAFAMGIPTEEAREKTWDAQKVPIDKHVDGMSDNYIDDLSFWN